MKILKISFYITLFLGCSGNLHAWSSPIVGEWHLLSGFNTQTHKCYGHTYTPNNKFFGSPSCDEYSLDFLLDKNFAGGSRINGIVKSVGSGEVVFRGDQPSYGNTIIIRHENNIYSRYSHLRSINVYNGQIISENEYIGRSGNSGSGVGDYPHLHFSMYEIVNNYVKSFKPDALGGLRNWPDGGFTINGKIPHAAPKLRGRYGSMHCVLNCFGGSLKQFGDEKQFRDSIYINTITPFLIMN